MTRTLTLACISLLLVASIIYRPDDAFEASLQGLTIWWNIVFPGLLPFLTLLELMLAFGAVHAAGVLLEPAMRRLFRLPGEAALPVALGWAGGFPCGAEAAAELRRRGIVTRREGQRLLALAHMPSPLFMLLVVGAGFMQAPAYGAAVAAAVWLAAVAAALIHSRLGSGEKPPSSTASGSGLLNRAASAIAEAQRVDGRSFGKALGDAVTAAVYKLLAVGGFMMIGAVLVKLLEPLAPGSGSFVLPALIETHIGAYAAATAQLPGGAVWNAAAAAAALAWSGASGLLQAGSSIAGTDLSLGRLALSRLLQAAIAGGFTFALWRPLGSLLTAISPSAETTFGPGGSGYHPAAAAVRAAAMPSFWPLSLLLMCSVGFIAAMLYASPRLLPRMSPRK